MSLDLPQRTEYVSALANLLVMESEGSVSIAVLVLDSVWNIVHEHDSRTINGPKGVDIT